MAGIRVSSGFVSFLSIALQEKNLMISTPIGYVQMVKASPPVDTKRRFTFRIFMLDNSELSYRSESSIQRYTAYVLDCQYFYICSFYIGRRFVDSEAALRRMSSRVNQFADFDDLQR